MAATRLASRALVLVRSQTGGDEAHAFLQDLLTNDVRQSLPVYAGLLSPQGKTLFDMVVWKWEDALALDCEAASADALVKRLTLYRLRRSVSIARAQDVAVHWSPEPVAGAVRDPRLAALGWRWLAAAGGEVVDGTADADWTAHRIACGVPEGAAEMADILWLETNAAELNGVSFTKGCYVGQENTARMNWRQKINRRLAVLPLEFSDPQRRRIVHEELGMAVDHRRVEDLAALPIPQWQRNAIHPDG
ncbi:folate-binding protein [Erythrobacteraceae bacterium CFH 75059]|uniref:CAF17-like 4Fe-4S cluster assembly/insertion protein YgfZ n=1 Tax=Qipengyuania thermophila TaxID=2509361 RepID=UPI0010203008|nr:folate-binding protein YgfZ [Qipengyuania thermophila]TCD04953.1 folate-binding protein [Erythrobacteraceae bacterium CFH 75059]